MITVVLFGSSLFVGCWEPRLLFGLQATGTRSLINWAATNPVRYYSLLSVIGYRDWVNLRLALRQQPF